MENKYQDIVSNLDYLFDTFGMELLEELVDIFTKQKLELVSDWQCSKVLTDEKVRQSAHKIKSSARNVGANQVGALFQLIEDRASEAMAKTCLGDIESEFAFFTHTFIEWKKQKERYEQGTNS